MEKTKKKKEKKDKVGNMMGLCERGITVTTKTSKINKGINNTMNNDI